MIKVTFQGEEHILETINGYYRLEDLSGPDPKIFMRTQGAHRPYSIQFRKDVWVSQAKVYQYCAWADPVFKAAMDAALEAGDARLALATGVIHK